MEEVSKKTKSGKKRRKAFLTKQFYLWHWVSGAVSLTAMLLFALTGITLNHAEDIKSKPKITTAECQLPSVMLSMLRYEEGEKDTETYLPQKISKFIQTNINIALQDKLGEWSEYEIYFELARPGNDAWLMIDRETGEVSYEKTNRGVISFMNDLHQGRNTSTAWSWYMDIFSVACIIFTVSGLALLYVHAKRRPSTWPIIALGTVIPIIIIIFFIH